MRFVVGGLAMVLAASAAIASAKPPPDRIEIVYAPDAMSFSIEDGGAAQLVGAEGRFAFNSTHEDYARVRRLLRPLKEEGVPCDDPAQASRPHGYIAWRERGQERRLPMFWACYTERQRSLMRHSYDAYGAMQEIARTRWRPPPPLPAPTRISVAWASWGRPIGGWEIVRGGQGRYTQDAETVVFPVSAEAFDRVREIFRPHEGTRFECRRVLTDLPYGSLTWSQAGMEDQRIHFDSGCVSGDADLLFERLERAQAMVTALRGGAP